MGFGKADGYQETLEKSVDRFKRLSRYERPFISVITPTWNTKPEWFSELAVSLLEQSFLDWEWCIVDDNSSNISFQECFANLQLPNVQIERLKERKGISGATNHGLNMARGKFVCFVDHDDLLPRNALATCLESIDGGVDAIYTDSDKIDEQGRRSEPFHKPDWSPEYFRGVMYVGHLLCVRRQVALEIGGFDSQFDGVQDFEFFLRFSEKTDRIRHVPEILYHWRTVPGSVATQTDAKGDLGRLQRAAVQAQLDRLGLRADAKEGEYPHRVKIVPHPRVSWPKVSVIIPTKNSPDILRQSLYSLFARTTYSNFEVVCVDNETSDRQALEEMKNAPIQRVILSGQFNFSKANNLALQYSTGEYLVFMNNDIEVVSPDWIEQMLYYAEQADVGAVGALLVYPDGNVQHAGIVLGCRGTGDHVLRGIPGDADGYAGSLSCAREVTAVTAACLMLRRELFLSLGGLNEHFFTAYQDLDLCLRIRDQKKRIIFTPQARFVHRESVSRGKYYDFVDRNLLLDYWEPLIKQGDPYYNPHLSLEPCDYSLGT
ncbi:MAG: glycosyltransferase family 2 protein [Acidobacteriaceae bacterium]|nr:glycosyltransferase family 2 protein [Acidobacteriaceae bacterium]MBV9767231.1 glycosyltransferase family 2 protein [Acidobacteriaceae bacterium]